MRDILVRIAKLSLSAIIWVFVLSINISGKPLFNYANRVLVQNEIVGAVDREISGVFTRIKDSVQMAFTGETPVKKRL